MNQKAITDDEDEQALRQKIEAEGKCRNPNRSNQATEVTVRMTASRTREQDHGGEDDRLDLMAIARRMCLTGTSVAMSLPLFRTG